MTDTYRIEEVVFVLENALAKGRYNTLRPQRKSDCFVYVLAGSATYRFSDKTFTAHEGQVVYLAKDSQYDMMILAERYEFIFVDFFFSDRNSEQRESDVYDIKYKSLVESLFRQLLNVWITRGTTGKLDSISILYAIYAKIVSGMEVYTPGSKAAKIKNAYEYIVEHYSDEINTDEFGKMCGITETHFRRLFKEVYGISPVKYINRLRIERAQGLLTNSNLSLSQIAEMVGYGDIGYFCRVFKANVGVSPSAYRNIYLKPDERSYT